MFSDLTMWFGFKYVSILILRYLYAFRRVLSFCGWIFFPKSYQVGLLTTTSVIYMVLCFHHRKNLVNENIVRHVCLLFLFLWETFCFFLDVFNFFDILQYRNRAAEISHWCHFCDSANQFLGFYGCHVLVLNHVKWAIRGPQAESIQLET